MAIPYDSDYLEACSLRIHIGRILLKGVRLLCEAAMLRYIMVLSLNYSYHWKALVPSPYIHSPYFLCVSFMGLP